MSRWAEGGTCKNMRSCDTAERSASLAAEERRMGIGLPVTLQRKSVKNLGVNVASVFFEVLYLLAAGRKMCFIRRFLWFVSGVCARCCGMSSSAQMPLALR